MASKAKISPSRGKAAARSGKARGGRPTKYAPAQFPDQARVACGELGATDEDLAKLFGVQVRTIANWKVRHPEFLQALKEGKDHFDSQEVEASLRRRALGYDYAEEHYIVTEKGKELRRRVMKQQVPDTTAGIFWLCNRQPHRWKRRLELGTDPETARTIAEVLREIDGLTTGVPGDR